MLGKLSVLMAALMMVAALGGCATTAKGPSPEEQIRQAVAGWTAAAVAKDVDKLMAFVSDDFSSGEWPDKASYKAFVTDSIEMGYLDDLEVSTENMKVAFEGDKGTAEPIDITAAFGSAVLSAVFEEEDGKWLITDVTMVQ